MLRSLLILTCWLPAVALAQKIGDPLVGTRKVVNNGPGNQLHPHVSDALVAYTSTSETVSEIRYHDLSTGLDMAIPNGGAYDSVADISGDTVVFTRLSASSAIYTYNVTTQAAPVEVAPQPGSSRSGAVIGHHTLVWQDYSYGPVEPEITAFNLDTLALTRLSNDEALDHTPAVSADGSVVVWTKCPSSASCDVWQAAAVPGGFEMMALTSGEGDEAQPDTNGQIVVYSSERAENGGQERDIYWQPVGGGAEYRLALPGVDTNPSISGTLIAFERQDPTSPTPNYDLMLFDLKTNTLYRLTATPQSENLNDISVGMDGLVRVVWSMSENGFDVHSFIFRLPGEPQCQPDIQSQMTAEELCANPGTRTLLASFVMERSEGEPEAQSHTVSALGSGVLCVDNGFEGARSTAGWLTLGGSEVVNPSDFQNGVAQVAREVSFSGEMELSARIAGMPGSAFRVRAYGPPPVCARKFPSEEVIDGELVVPQRWEPPVGGEQNLGCGAGGDSLAWVGALLVVALLWRYRPTPVPARHKDRRRVR
jgi:Tol biopolymer transport system component